MTKKIFSFLLMLVACTLTKAQVSEGRTTIDTTIRPAVIIETDMDASETEAAIESYFDSMHIQKEKGKGFLIKKSLGYMLFKKAKVETGNDYLDYYFVVEEKKQKGKDGAVVYITVAKGSNNFYTDKDKSVWGDLRSYADYLQTNYFEQFKLYTQLATVNKNLDKRKKKLSDLLKEKTDLETNISSDSLQIATMNEQLLKLKTKQ